MDGEGNVVTHPMKRQDSKPSLACANKYIIPIIFVFIFGHISDIVILLCKMIYPSLSIYMYNYKHLVLEKSYICIRI